MALAKANAQTPDPTTALRAPVDGGGSKSKPSEGSTDSDVGDA
jgi:hypothetical protein